MLALFTLEKSLRISRAKKSTSMKWASLRIPKLGHRLPTLHDCEKVVVQCSRIMFGVFSTLARRILLLRHDFFRKAKLPSDTWTIWPTSVKLSITGAWESLSYHSIVVMGTPIDNDLAIRNNFGPFIILFQWRRVVEDESGLEARV